MAVQPSAALGGPQCAMHLDVGANYCTEHRIALAPYPFCLWTRVPERAKDQRVCLVICFYYMDREFGLLHVKIQTWFPFTMQVYVNGHEWLARKLTAQGIAFRKVDNAFVWLPAVQRAQAHTPGFWRRDWPKFLGRLAARVNPLLADWLAGQSYYWVMDQAEFSSDVLFADKAALETLRPRLYADPGTPSRHCRKR